MFSLEIVLLGLALAIDAAVVTFAFSLMQVELPANHKMQNGFLLSLAFGFSQFLMLWMGSYAGYMFTFSSIGYYFQFGVAAIFLILAAKCLQESFSLEDKNIKWGFLPLMILAVATSIDALASGVSLATIPEPYKASMEVGAVTFIVCAGFYALGQTFRKIPSQWLMRLAAGIFLFLSGQILWSLKFTYL